MIQPINRDLKSLAQTSVPASKEDAQVVTDLADTLQYHHDTTVGMAANMIGVHKRVIVVLMGMIAVPMINPVITAKSEPYETEEGCLSLAGVRAAHRFSKITVKYLDRTFTHQKQEFTGFTAQIIQHEVDHCNGVII